MLSSSINAFVIRASALASVKYKFDPSVKSPVFLELKSKFAPVCKLTLASALALVKYKLVEPSDNASVSAAAILASALASALAFVKYKFVEPSATVSVSPCVNVNTPVPLLYESCADPSLIAALALAFVKYKLLAPSVKLSVVLVANLLSKSE